MTTARTSGEQPGTPEANRRAAPERVVPEALGTQREGTGREGTGRRRTGRPQTPAQRTAEHDDLLRPNPPFPGDDD